MPLELCPLDSTCTGNAVTLCSDVHPHQRKTLVKPAGNPANHFFHRETQLSQANRRPMYAIAMRPRAINNEKRLARIVSHAFCADGAARNIDRARHMALRKRLAAPYIYPDRLLGPQGGQLYCHRLGNGHG